MAVLIYVTGNNLKNVCDLVAFVAYKQNNYVQIPAVKAKTFTHFPYLVTSLFIL